MLHWEGPSYRELLVWPPSIGPLGDPTDPLLLVVEHAAAWSDGELLALRDWSTDDQERMGRFRHQGAKTSWALSRHLFREVLAECFGLTWVSSMQTLGPFGKPGLAGGRPQYNWSHTEGVVFLAFSRDAEIGCDIEDLLGRQGDFRSVAEACFSQKERNWMESAPGESAIKARFLTLFVEREARGKADGRGLVLDWDGPESALLVPPFCLPNLAVFRYGSQDRYFLSVAAERINPLVFPPVLTYRWPRAGD